MGKGLFVTGTGTDVGKTYIAALMVKKLKDAGLSAGYYKAALSGAESIIESDAGYVKRISGIQQPDKTLLSYLYETPVSPHLGAKIHGNPVCMARVREDYRHVEKEYDYVTVEGSGGIVCPIRWDKEGKFLLEDIVKTLGLSAVIVADAGLGTINSTVLTAEYLNNHSIKTKGIILNRYSGGIMQEDNIRMTEELTHLPVLAVVAEKDTELNLKAEVLASLYQ